MSLIPSSTSGSSQNTSSARQPYLRGSARSAEITYTRSTIDADGRRTDKEAPADPNMPGYEVFRSILDKHPLLGPLLLNRSDCDDPDGSEPEAEPEPEVRMHRNPRQLTAAQQAHAPGWQVLDDGTTLSQALGRYLTALFDHQHTQVAELLGRATAYCQAQLAADSTHHVLQRFDAARKFVGDLEEAAAGHQAHPAIETARRNVFASASAAIQNGNIPRDAHALLTEALQRLTPDPAQPPPASTSEASTTPGSTTTQTTMSLAPAQAQRLAVIEDFYSELLNRTGATGLTITKTAFYWAGRLYFIPLDTALQVFPEGRSSRYWFFTNYQPALGSVILVSLPGETTDQELRMEGGRYRVVGRRDWQPNPFFIDDPVVRELQLSALRNALENRPRT